MCFKSIFIDKFFSEGFPYSWKDRKLEIDEDFYKDIWVIYKIQVR